MHNAPVIHDTKSLFMLNLIKYHKGYTKHKSRTLMSREQCALTYP